MKYLFAVLILVLATFVSWPYAYLYRIDKALHEGDRDTLSRLVDLEAVRAEIKRNIDRDVDTALGKDTGSVLGWLKEKVSELGEHAIEEIIDLAWISRTLTEDGRFRQQVSFAFFESWDVFLIRLGELGREPVHIRMTLTRGNWRITAIYQ